MEIRSEDARRLAAVAEHDRARTIDFLDKAVAAGDLSPAERDDRVEQAFRAKAVGDLDAVVSDLPGSATLRLFVRGVASPRAAWLSGWSWQRRLVAWFAVSVAFWTVVFLVAGGSFVWLALAWLFSLVALTARFARRGRSRRRRAAAPRGYAGF